jgi:hypothetical protein
MSFQKAVGHVSHQNPKGEEKTLIEALHVKAHHIALRDEILAWAKALEGGTEDQRKRRSKGILQREELKQAHKALRQRDFGPYFMVKNLALKSEEHPGCYDITRLKLDNNSTTAAVAGNKKKVATAEKQPAVTKKKPPKKEAGTSTGGGAPTTSAKKPKAAKKSATPKKEESSKKKEIPVTTDAPPSAADLLPETSHHQQSTE